MRIYPGIIVTISRLTLQYNLIEVIAWYMMQRRLVYVNLQYRRMFELISSLFYKKKVLHIHKRDVKQRKYL